MSCCQQVPHGPSGPAGNEASLAEERLRVMSRSVGDGLLQTEFHVPAMHCTACMRKIERELGSLPGVETARANLSTKRVRVTWQPAVGQATLLADGLTRAGFEATPLQPGAAEDDATLTHLILCLGVAGFAAANVMLLSVSVWSGADGPTRQLFHLISGLIAVPAAIYSGQPFFSSALAALRHGRLNMDVPISLAILLALVLSMHEAMTDGEEAYFDAAVMLLFFLLIGRTLDYMMRERARGAVKLLAGLAAKGAVEIRADGSRRFVAPEDVVTGSRLFVAAGERIPVDGVVRGGASDVDRALVTGESAPVRLAAGDTVEAGTLNLSGPLEIEATKPAERSFLAEVIAMMEAAENGKARFVRIADRAAQIYAPVVHLLALATFVGWMLTTGGDWHAAAFTAIAVLIITCPCALGLAVPIVHVIGAGRLFERGVLIKDGTGFEKLRLIDTVVLDKTGTLTLGRPEVTGSTAMHRQRQLTRLLARASVHPASKALSRYLDAEAPGDVEITAIREVPGSGVEARASGRSVRLGRRDWVAEIAGGTATTADLRENDSGSDVWFAEEGTPGNPPAMARFRLADTLRPGARTALAQLERTGLKLEILSGDTPAAVRAVADAVGIADFHASQTPAQKIAHIEHLQARGHRVLMVGDGLNDAPALAAGDASMTPSAGSDVGRQAADFVFTGESLDAIPFAHGIAIRADRLVKQNIAIAVAYNCVAVPLALFGYVTPLVAAIAMSASSVVVVANSMRLRWDWERSGRNAQATEDLRLAATGRMS